jgi:hypothetical protein
VQEEKANRAVRQIFMEKIGLTKMTLQLFFQWLVVTQQLLNLMKQEYTSRGIS